MGADIHVILQYRPLKKTKLDDAEIWWSTFIDFDAMDRDYLLFALLGYPHYANNAILEPCWSLENFKEQYGKDFSFLPERWVMYDQTKKEFVLNPDLHTFGIMSLKDYRKVYKKYIRLSKDISSEYKYLLSIAEMIAKDKNDVRMIYCFDC